MKVQELLSRALLNNLSTSDSEDICALLKILRLKQIAQALSARSTNFSEGSNTPEDERLKLFNRAASSEFFRLAL